MLDSEFQKALEWLREAEQQQQLIPPKNQYRVYYDGAGIPTYIANGPGWPDRTDRYIELTREQANQCTPTSNRVVNNQLINLDNQQRFSVQLTKSSDGDYQAVSSNMGLLIEAGEQYETTTKYTIGGHR